MGEARRWRTPSLRPRQPRRAASPRPTQWSEFAGSSVPNRASLSTPASAVIHSRTIRSSEPPTVPSTVNRRRPGGTLNIANCALRLGRVEIEAFDDRHRLSHIRLELLRLDRSEIEDNNGDRSPAREVEQDQPYRLVRGDPDHGARLGRRRTEDRDSNDLTFRSPARPAPGSHQLEIEQLPLEAADHDVLRCGRIDAGSSQD